MDTNEHYVQVRPNPYALTHTEIFQRLTGGSSGVSGLGGPTEPLLTNGELLRRALDELSVMVAVLEGDYRADSTGLARQAIARVSDHVGALADQATRVATGFDGYVEAYQEARARVPQPVPFADQLDTVQQRSPGLLAQVPGLAQLEEEHNARTRAAQEEYQKLDLAAVAADESTPAFPLLFRPATRQVDTVGFESTGGPGRAVGSDPSVPTGTQAGLTAPAGGMPASPGTAPAPTSGASGHGAGQATPPPLPPGSPAPGGGGPAGSSSSALRVPVTGRDGGGSGSRRPGGASGDARDSGRRGTYSNMSDRPDRGPQRGPQRGQGAEGGGARPWPADAGTPRAARGGGAAGTGLGPAGTRRDHDHEHQRPSYLEEAADPNVIFGADVRVAPAVIGDDPRPTTNR